MATRSSIRITLQVVLGILNLLIILMLGYGVVTSFQEYRNADSLIESADIMNPLFTGQKHLAEERSWSVAAVYVGDANKQQYIENLNRSRADVDRDIRTALDQIRDKRIKNITLSMSKVEDDYKKLIDMRQKVDSYLAQPSKSVTKTKQTDAQASVMKANVTANDIVVATTSLVTSVRLLRADYSRQLLVISPSAWSQLQLSSIVGEVTEYANREYTVLAKLIAENQYPDQGLQEQLALWRGRISYGWDMMRSAAAGNDWSDKALPIIENAENDYFSTFDEIKTIFQPVSQSSPQATPNYDMSVEEWLDTASKAVDSIYAMNELVMEIGSDYRKHIQEEARWSIGMGIMMFLLALSVSIYLWRVMTFRVVRPLDMMVDSLYKTAHGENAKIPTFNHSPEEIVKLAKVLKAMQSYSRQLQYERDNAEMANRAKTDFLANISHELRTPMNVVLGLLDILQRTETMSVRQKGLLTSLDESAKSLLSIINDLLDFSEFESSSLKLDHSNFDLYDMLVEISTTMSEEAQRKGLRTEISINDIEKGQYWGDPSRLRQILANLYANAIKFTSEGFIRLEAESQPFDNDQDLITIRIIDSGIGIPKGQHQRIFEKFTQVNASINRKYGGTGLGLAISRVLIEMMEGSITVVSEEGKGAIFTVRFPLSRKNNASVANENVNISHESAKTVLLVEDYPPNVIVGTKYLQDLGFDCDVVETGREAFEKVQNKEYAAVLLDIKLTDMLGYDVAKAIRGYEQEAGKMRTHIIGVTAFANGNDQERCLSAGMDDCLLKPYTFEQLSAKIAAGSR